MMTTHGNLQKHTNPNPVQQKLLNRFHRTVIDIVRMVKPTNLLDAGCGEGFTGRDLRQAWPELAMMGVDISEVALAWNQANLMSQAPLGQSDVCYLPFADASFEMVMSLEVLEHLPDSRIGLREYLRVAQKFVLVSVPHEPFFRGANFLRGKHISAWGNDPEHLHNYSAAAFRQLVAGEAEVVLQTLVFPWQIILAQKK
jgi:ubiquinone/menaquinone biosynthesis C-methylase UbiE